MPFDTTAYTNDTIEALCKRDEVLRVLVEADRLLSGPEKWCQGKYEGFRGQRCSVGWISAAQSGRGKGALAVTYMTKLVGGALSTWNDAPERTFADVKALFARAISERARAVRGG